jgi:hypothetical protein
MRRRDFLSLALAVPVTGWSVSACALFRPRPSTGLTAEEPAGSDVRYSEAPGDDVIQGVAETPSRAWQLLYASMPLPGDRLVW